jgi:hypothetical protein
MWMNHTTLNKHEQRLVDMDREAFEHYVYSKYPELFVYFTAKPEAGAPIMPASFGLEISRGWYHVVDAMCRQLELLRILTGITVKFQQIKEKFGSGRFYFTIGIADDAPSLTEEDRDTARSIADDIVGHFEEYTQYVCGELGTNTRQKVSTGSWMHDCSLEGFTKRWNDRDGGVSRIALATKNWHRREALTELKEDIDYLDYENRLELSKIVSKMHDEQRREGARLAAEAQADAAKEDEATATDTKA